MASLFPRTPVLLRTRVPLRRISLGFQRCTPPLIALEDVSTRRQSTLPRIAQVSIWTSLIPKFLRRSHIPSKSSKPRSKEWNPATFFIVIFMLIGSQAIQMIAIRHEFATFSRKADAKIILLREVIQRVQNGEDVDVEGLLGTGDAVKEKEWEEVMREIEEDEAYFIPKEEIPSNPELNTSVAKQNDVTSDKLAEASFEGQPASRHSPEKVRQKPIASIGRFY